MTLRPNFIQHLPYRWRYMAALVLPLIPSGAAYFLIAPWILWLGITCSIAAVWLVAQSHRRWIRSTTASTLTVRTTDSTHRVDATGPNDEVRLAHAINHLADSAVAAIDNANTLTKYHETILDTIADGVLVIDRDGSLVYHNNAAQTIFGLVVSDEDAPAHDLTSKVNVLEVAETAAACLEVGTVQRTNVNLFNPSRHLLIWAAPINTSQANEQRALLIVRDRTIEHRQSESLNEFIANASHELRTPITVVLASVETLKMGGKFQGVEAEFLDRMEASTKKMGVLVDELMDLTMLETGKAVLHIAPERVSDIIRITVDELRPIAQQRGVRLTIGEVDASASVNADADKLQRALVNLVTNAIKFSSHGDTVRVAAAAQGATVAIRVVDEGRGIDADDLPHVFDRFFRRQHDPGDEPGFGLGLAIVKNIVELHDGTVSVESTLSAGSTFTITLPALNDPTLTSC